MAKRTYPTRGEGFTDWNTPLSSQPIKGDVVPPVDNPAFPARDPLDLMRDKDNKQSPRAGGARKSTVKQ
jgi:hypothetical protein